MTAKRGPATTCGRQRPLRAPHPPRAPRGLSALPPWRAGPPPVVTVPSRTEKGRQLPRGRHPASLRARGPRSKTAGCRQPGLEGKLREPPAASSATNSTPGGALHATSRCTQPVPNSHPRRGLLHTPSRVPTRGRVSKLTPEPGTPRRGQRCQGRPDFTVSTPPTAPTEHAPWPQCAGKTVGPTVQYTSTPGTPWVCAGAQQTTSQKGRKGEQSCKVTPSVPNGGGYRRERSGPCGSDGGPSKKTFPRRVLPRPRRHAGGSVGPRHSLLGRAHRPTGNTGRSRVGCRRWGGRPRPQPQLHDHTWRTTRLAAAALWAVGGWRGERGKTNVQFEGSGPIRQEISS